MKSGTRPKLYVIAGPNGSGKTTFAKEFLPNFAECPNFVNVDLIASGLSPFQPERAAIAAGKLMLRQIGDLSRRRENFGFETTLSGRSYLRVLQDLQKQGYLVSLFFLWLPKVDMAIQRVKDRVRLGGHSVEDVDIRRRFERGIRNFSAYREIVNEWQIIDGSITPPVSLAYGQSFIWKCESKELEPILTRMVMGHEK